MTDEATNVALRDMAHELGEVRGLLTGIRHEQHRTADAIVALDKRVAALEQRDAKLLGVAAGVSGATSLVVGWIKNFLETP